MEHKGGFIISAWAAIKLYLSLWKRCQRTLEVWDTVDIPNGGQWNAWIPSQGVTCMFSLVSVLSLLVLVSHCGFWLVRYCQLFLFSTSFAMCNLPVLITCRSLFVWTWSCSLWVCHLIKRRCIYLLRHAFLQPPDTLNKEPHLNRCGAIEYRVIFFSFNYPTKKHIKIHKYIYILQYF